MTKTDIATLRAALHAALNDAPELYDLGAEFRKRAVND